MRIGIDCRTILNPEKGEGAGIGHYTYQLVRHLLKVDKTNTYVLLFDRTVQKRRLDRFKKKNAFIKFFPFIQYTRLMPMRYAHFLASAFLAREKLDVFHSPTPSLPLSYRGPSVVTAHDLAIYKFPELYTAKQNFLLKTDIPNAVQKAKKIITPSFSTAKDLGEIFGISSKKIKVIFHGLDKRFFERMSADRIEKVKGKYGIKGEYLFFIGTLDSRKNICRIIEAYERLRDKIIQGPKAFSGVVSRPREARSPFLKYKLVLAGDRGFKFEEIEKKIASSHYRKDIILPGYIEADDLDALFEGAKLFVFPSLYEGFGLPVIEAMANGTPVVTSNISSLPEVAEEHALLVDPYDTADIAQAMVALLTDTRLHQDLARAGRTHVRQFTWEKCARATIKVYQEVL